MHNGRSRGAHRRRRLIVERERLRAELLALLDPVMAVLGLLALVLLLVQFAANLTATESEWVNNAETAIWAIFIVEFAVQFALAPHKLRFLRRHWLTAIAVALPTLRVLRVLRAASALRAVGFLGLLSGSNRAMAALRAILRNGQLGYLVALTVLVVAIGTVGSYAFEHSRPNATIKTLGEALWWASCLVTTINNEDYPVTAEGRVLGILLRLYALSVFGYLATKIAAFFIGKQEGTEEAQEVEASTTSSDIILAELRRLQAEVAALANLTPPAPLPVAGKGGDAAGGTFAESQASAGAGGDLSS